VGVSCSTRGRGERCIINVVSKPERKIRLRRRRCIWEDNIKIDLKPYEVMDWIHPSQDMD